MIEAAAKKVLMETMVDSFSFRGSAVSAACGGRDWDHPDEREPGIHMGCGRLHGWTEKYTHCHPSGKSRPTGVWYS